ncbi:MAG: ATP-binding protein, partial [Verrucomicrobiota bacterium]|nr:ATP-binding protein [Verrucomicrobiota bacterium]
MSDLEQWQASNARQLSAALAEVRRRLDGSKAPPDSATAPTPELPSALTILGQRFGLSAFERDILLLCAAVELDTRTAGLCARAQDDPAKPFPTFALALAIFDQPTWDALAPDGPLRYWRLLEINQAGVHGLTSSSLRADERIVNYLKGLNHLDERVASFTEPLEIEAGAVELAPSQLVIAETISRRWSQVAPGGPLPVAQLLGADSISKQLVAHAVAAKLQRNLCRLPAELLPSAAADLETLARLWERESRLLPLALYLDAEDAEASVLHRFLARTDGFCFLATREAMARPGRIHFAVDVAKPTPAEQEAIWSNELSAEAPESPAQLGAQFNFNLPTIRRLAPLARAESAESAVPLAETVWELCRQSERRRLDALAQRLEPKMTWDDLVLPPNETKLLREIAAQVGHRQTVYEAWGFARKMNRGFGISALFAGESGCGKTMAAEVLAHELRLNLYRIDLSAVVNKYIGETEKNLRRLFDAAEEGGSILFFD